MHRVLFLIATLLFMSPAAEACVGKNLTIGVMNSPEGQVLGEMLSALITERTGTSVTIKHFKDMRELYDAVKAKQVDISVENTSRAMRMLNRPVEADARKAYDTAKAIYEREKGLIWLKPFGFLRANGPGSSSHTAAVLRTEVISNFPVLPRVIDKLGGAVNDETYAKLIASVELGEAPRKVARDFLRSRKLI